MTVNSGPGAQIIDKDSPMRRCSGFAATRIYWPIKDAGQTMAIARKGGGDVRYRRVWRVLCFRVYRVDISRHTNGCYVMLTSASSVCVNERPGTAWWKIRSIG